MADDFLSSFLGNADRARIIRVFVLNQTQVFTIAQCAKRSGVNKISAAREVRALEKIGLLKKARFAIQVGKEKRTVTGKQSEGAWTFNIDQRYALALSKFIHEISPPQYKAIVGALRGSGRLTAIILSGSFMGDPSRPVDLIVAADTLNEDRLESSIRGLEPGLGREIRYAVFSTPEFRYRLTIEDKLLRNTLDYPHVVLLDRTRLLS